MLPDTKEDVMSEENTNIISPPIEVETATAEWQRTTPEKFPRDAFRGSLDRSRISAQSEDPAESHCDAHDLEEDVMSEAVTNTISPSEEVEESEDLAERAAAAEGETSSPATANKADVEAVRALILASHTDIVPELIGGDSIAALIASITPAQAAYHRIAGSLNLPAGGNTAPVVVNADALSSMDKIRRGLEVRPHR